MWDIVLNIVLAVVGVLMAFTAYYLEIKRKIVEAAGGEISNAQDVTTDNAERMAYVVEQLKKIVPAPLRFLFTDEAIKKIAQAAFDKIKEYAKKHAKEKAQEK
jgi:predicted RNA-binding protein YlxR (DUF448 family)